MDPNGLRFWLLADEGHWRREGDPPRLQYDAARRSLRLACSRTAPSSWRSNRAEGVARLERIPMARDRYGTSARWNAELRQVVATGAMPGEVPIYAPPGGETPTDLALGYDGVLYLAVGGGVSLHDRRLRRQSVLLRPEGFASWRLAPDPDGGTWVLDRQNRQLGWVSGSLWPRMPFGRYDPDVFRPCSENPDPPELSVVLREAWPANERAAAIACSPEGRLALLTWRADGQARLRLLRDDGTLSPPVRLEGAFYPYSLAWVSAGRVGVLLAGVDEAPVYPVSAPTSGDATRVLPVGDRYPLRDAGADPFLHGLTLPPHYPLRSGGSAPLHHLSLPAFARRGRARGRPLLDSGDPRTEWHRLYVEAVIPPGCGVTVRLAASDVPAAPADADEWYEHRFGSVFPPTERGRFPHGAWVPFPSELPFHPGLLPEAPEPERAGLFTALIQRARRRVRTLRGRFLWVEVELLGSGLASPEVAAVRAYASRFSYAAHYLPELYRESVFGADADERADRSTPADFLERMLGNFEGILTPLEDRIAHAHLLTDPRTAPDESLEWLAGWIGLSFDSAIPLSRRRDLLRAAPELARYRGTLRGLALALDVATGGAVRGGEIVVLEDFRLRRTFATILGADLADEEDPLLGGLTVSGNSFVGDTLVLGEESRREFLALFGADLPLTPAEQAAVAAFFERLAHRVTVLVHQDVEPQDLGLIRRVVELETPAHVEARVLTATHPLIVGAASLVGYDTYLRRRPGRTPVRVGGSRVGVRDFLIGPVSLDPRLEGGGARRFEPPPVRPTADPGEDFDVRHGESFPLDAGRSRPGPGRTIDWYRWTRLD